MLPVQVAVERRFRMAFDSVRQGAHPEAVPILNAPVWACRRRGVLVIAWGRSQGLVDFERYAFAWSRQSRGGGRVWRFPRACSNSAGPRRAERRRVSAAR